MSIASFIQIGTLPVLQHHFTGVGTVSLTAGLDRVDGVTLFLSLKDITNTCQSMQNSPTIGAISEVI